MKFKPYPQYILRRPAFNYDCDGLDDDKLKEMLDNEYFLESIFYASPELYKELKKIVENKDSKSIPEKTLDTIYKYASRLRYRSTPFGSFVACGVGEYGEELKIPGVEKIVKSYKYDGQLIYNVAEYILKEKFDKLTELKLKCNETIFKVNGFYFVWARSSHGDMELIKVPITELLQFCVSITSETITLKDLVVKILNEFDISRNDAYKYVKSLCKKGVLIDNVKPETVGEDNLHRLEFANASLGLDVINILRNNLNTLSSNLSLKEKIKQINEIEESLRLQGIKYNEKQIIQVDSYLRENIVLPSSARKSLQEIFTIYQSISPAVQGSLSSFIKRYQARYEQESISVLEALNPISGIGYQNNMGQSSDIIKSILSKPKKHERLIQSMSVNLSVLEQIVLEKIRESGDLNLSKIKLTYKDFKPYIKYNIIDPPLSYSAMYKIVGYNEQGPIISKISFSGSSGLSLLTRFAHGSKKIENIVKDIADMEQRNSPNCILAEISHLTAPHSENVQARPMLRDAIISIASQNLTDPKLSIDIGELYIRISRGKVHLFSKKMNKEVIPCFTSAFNYSFRSSDLYKFLGDVAHQNMNRVFKPSFNGLLKLFRHTPRIEYKNIIISPESWNLSQDDLYIKNKFSNERFKDYCTRNKLPRFLLYAQGDNTFIIDLEIERSISVFGKLISRKSDIIIEEFMPQATDFNHYDTVIEVVQPFITDN